MSSINSYSFFLNTSANNFTDGSCWAIPLPTNISVSNPANSFQGFITEASIPQTPFLISDQIGNNTFEFKLQVYVKTITQAGQVTSIEKWMDCTEVQKQYLNSLQVGLPGYQNWVQAFATQPAAAAAGFDYGGPANWCDFEANKVIVANGNYTDNTAFVTAITTALTATMNTLTTRMKNLYHYYGPQAIKSFTNNIALSGADKSDFFIAMSNLWGVHTATTISFQIEFQRYRLYIKSNEIFSMLGFTDRDTTFDFADCSPQFLVPGDPNTPLYTAQLNPVSYVSPNVMNLNPNVNYYVAVLNLSQTKSFVAVNGNAVTSQTFSSLFRSSSLPRSEVYYSLPTVIQIQDKNFNFLELCIKDYRNRTIPTVLFSSPIYITIVFQEILGNQTTPAINLQQLNDIDAVFWRQKELELQFELESFIRTKRT